MATATGVFFMSLTAIPVSYSLNLFKSSLNEQWTLFAAGSVVLAVITFITYLIIKFTQKQNKPQDISFYVFSVFAWTCVIDLIIALELDGVIDNFITFYFKEGEVYLTTAHGVMICYWDGTGQYCMYLMMVTAIVWNQSYRDVGLYWAGSICNSMIVFLAGNFAGKYGDHITPSVIFNIPFAVYPFIAGFWLLKEKRNLDVNKVQVKSAQKCKITSRPLDMFFIMFFLFAGTLAFIRFLAALNSPFGLAQTYVKEYEPYLLDPVIYPKFQMITYWFYFVPYYCVAIYGLLYPGCEWMYDWSLIHGGAAIQAQIAHLGASVHSRTPYIYRVPEATAPVFWIINLALLFIPQLLAWRCTAYPEFFVKEDENARNGKVKAK